VVPNDASRSQGGRREPDRRGERAYDLQPEADDEGKPNKQHEHVQNPSWPGGVVAFEHQDHVPPFCHLLGVIEDAGSTLPPMLAA
jgi:hypothetical protein